MYTPNCDVFWVGSYPLKDPMAACRRILKNPNLLLHWPQLPKRSKKEKMVEQTYKAMATPNDDFSKGAASGWNAMWRALKTGSKRRSKVRSDTHFKTQIAGPITLFGKLQSQANEQKLLNQVTLWLKHAYWQIDQIKERGYKPILVLDEPLLPTFMGPSLSPRARKTLKLLRSIVKRVRARGAVVGIHCCNRISPEILIGLGVDLIHLDAYYFPTQLSRSRAALQRFLSEGGVVAWGVVPTTESLTATSQAKLEKNLTALLSDLESRGLPLRRVLAQSMVAPTCGTGSLTLEQSDKVMEFTTLLSRQLKSRHRL